MTFILILVLLFLYILGIQYAFISILAIKDLIGIVLPKWLCIFSIFTILFIMIKYTEIR